MSQYKNENGAYNPQSTQGGISRRELLVGGVAVVASLFSSGCNFLERIANTPSTVGRKAWNYGAIDDYVTLQNIKKGNIGDIAEGVVLYPADWALDMGVRAPVALAYDMPIEAWNGVSPAKVESTTGKILRIAVLPVTFPVSYGVVAVKGLGRQVSKRPLESVCHALAAYGVVRALDHHHHGWGRQQPGQAPAPEPIPPPMPWD